VFRRIFSVAGIWKPNLLCQIVVPKTSEAVMAWVNIGDFLFKTHLRN